MKVTVMGLGKLGTPMAAVFASRGHEVMGFDLLLSVVDAVNAGNAPLHETDLQRTMDRAGSRLRATNDPAIAVSGAQVIFIVVPTPSTPDGSFSVQSVLAAIREAGPVLGRAAPRPVVVVSSTVSPGSMDGLIRPVLEEASGLGVGVDVGLCYSPEFIALGSVIHDILNPDMVLVGESDPRSGQILSELLVELVDSEPVLARMNLVNAELAKIAVNTFVTTKISYANMLAEICELIPGADAEIVTRAVGLDSRINRKYLRPGAPYGGPCFPRDNKAMVALARSVGTTADLAMATDAINERQLERAADRLLEGLSSGSRVAILGMAYKSQTSVVDESAGLKLAHIVAKRGHQPVLYDPAAIAGAERMLSNRAEYVKSPAECIASADAVAIMTDWPEFRALTPTAPGPARSCRLLDCWRVLDAGVWESAGYDVFYPGVAAAIRHTAVTPID